MTAIVDAGPLVGLADPREPQREKLRAQLENEPGALVVPAPVTAEVDHLLGRRFGRSARRAFLDDLAVGRFTVGCLESADHATVAHLENQYADLDLGLADCSVIVLAARHRTDRVVTFDERHFRAVSPLTGGVFQLLPADG